MDKESYKYGASGRSDVYSKEYKILIYTLYRLFKFGLRQITSYFEWLWSEKGLDIAVPSYGHLSDMFAAMSLEVKHYCQKAVSKANNGEEIDLIVDSSGMRFDKAEKWHEEKYDKKAKKRPWRKISISID